MVRKIRPAAVDAFYFMQKDEHLDDIYILECDRYALKFHLDGMRPAPPFMESTSSKEDNSNEI